MNDVEPKDRDIAMVFQSYALYPHMSVEDNLGFPLKMRHEEKAGIADERPANGGPARDREASRPAPARSSRADSASAWRSGARWSETRSRS